MRKNVFLWLFALVLMLGWGGNSNASILVQTASGTYVSKLSLSAANTAADAAGKTIVITSPVTMTANITLSTDRAWKIVRGGSITTTGYTFNANGASFTAGDYQVFAGTGTVTGLREARPAWFKDSSTDWAPSINKALSSSPVTVLLPTSYLLKSTVSIPSGATLRGAGPATILDVASSGFVGERAVTNSDISGGNTNITIENLSIRATVDNPVTGARPGIIRLEKVDGLTVRGIHTTSDYSCNRTPVDLSGGIRNAVITGNRLKNASTTSGGALWVRGGQVDDVTLDCYNLTITDNVLHATADEALVLYGWKNTISNVAISGNVMTVTTGAYPAVAFLGYNVTNQDGIVHGVSFTGNHVNGKVNVLTGAYDINIVGNTVHGPTFAGVDAIFVSSSGDGYSLPYKINIADNVVRGAARYGIYAAGSDIKISGNMISGTTSDGIRGGTYILGNTVDMTGVAATGIFLASTRQVINNTTIGGSVGIGSFGAIVDTEIRGNRIKDPTVTAISLNGNNETPVTNYALQSEALDGSPWQTSGTCTVTANQATIPGASSPTMEQIQCSGNTESRYQAVSGASGATGAGPFTLSAWVSSVSGTATESIVMNLLGGTAATACTCTRSDAGACTTGTTGTIGYAYGTFGTTPVRLTLTCSATGSATSVNVLLHDGQYSASNGVGGRFGGAQLEKAAAVGTYVPTTTGKASAGQSVDVRVLHNSARSSAAAGTLSAIRAFDGTFVNCWAEGNTVAGAATGYSLTSTGWRKVGNKDTESNVPWPAATGTDAQRPTLSAEDAGFVYTSTTPSANGVPYWWNGAAWVKADGTIVP